MQPLSMTTLISFQDRGWGPKALAGEDIMWSLQIIHSTGRDFKIRTKEGRKKKKVRFVIVVCRHGKGNGPNKRVKELIMFASRDKV